MERQQVYVETARIFDFAPDEGVSANASGAEFDDTGWLEVGLPVDVHTALIGAGRLPHPYQDANEAVVAWVAEREWWYRCPFEVAGPALERGERLRLILHGVDTNVDVWLNGHHLGEHRSMFRPAVFDVTDVATFDGHNLLALRFANVVDPAADVSDVAVRDSLRIAQRKMQVAYGWDISCYLLTVGVWQPIELRRERLAALGPATFSTIHLDADGARAVVQIGARIDAFAMDGAGVGAVHYRLIASDGTVAAQGELGINGRGNRASAYAIVENPMLWWTRDLGTPHLYRLQLSLSIGADVVDTNETSVGIRTLTLDQSPDQAEPPNRFFRFVLNGHPIFARGANWVPNDLRLGTVSDEAYERRLRQALDANMNMIRVWGGGSYEKDAFYRTCDELGLLIWHDFMFACLPYAGDAEFLAECDREVRFQVARLQAHPSLALWCGNNEAHMNGDPLAGHALFGDVLPRAVADEDGSRPYWPGSPYGGNGFNSTQDGDTHDWRGFHGTHSAPFGEEGGWDPSGNGRHWRRYATDIGRFVSEFGFAGPATRPTIEHWNSAGERHPRTRAWQDRIRYVPGDSHLPLLETITGLPRTPDEWIDRTQLIQAEGFRFGIERFRERKPHCSGALLWQLNDCWPGFTWSIIDFDGYPKPSYFAVRRAFGPVLATINPLRGGQFELWVVNDSGTPIDDVIAVRIQRFDGAVLDEQRFTVHAAPMSDAQLVRRFGWGRVIHPRSCYVSIESARGSIPTNQQLFADLRDLELPSASIAIRAEAVDPHTVDVTVEADSFVAMAVVDHPRPDIEYSDNCFCLEPGRPRKIRAVHSEAEVEPSRFSVRAMFGSAKVL